VSLARKIFSNTAWQVIGKFITAVLGIVSIKFITNYLSRSTYGEYTTIYDYTALFAIIADFGLFTIAVREMAHHGNKIEKILGNVLSIRTVLAVAALGLGFFVTFLIPAYRGTPIPMGVGIVSIATVITLIAGTMSSLLQYHLKMFWTSIALSIGKIVTVGYIVLTITVFYPNDPAAGFPHLLTAWIIGGLITVLITYRAASKLAVVRFRFELDFWKDILIKALPYGLALMLGTIYFRMGTIVLSLLGEKEQVGLFGVPMRFVEILQIVPHYFMNSVLPILTASIVVNRQRAEKIVRYALNTMVTLSLPILMGGFMLSWQLTAAVSSPEFLTHRAADGAVIYGSDLALRILLGALVFTFLHVVFTYVLVAKGQQKLVLVANGIGATINILLNVILAPRYGFVGAALSVVGTEIVMFVTLTLLARRYLSNIWDLPFIAKTFVSTGAMGLVLWLTAAPLSALFHTKSLLILVPLGAAVFGLSMILTRAVSKEMVRLIIQKEPAKDDPPPPLTP